MLTSPPIKGCLQITIDCIKDGFLRPTPRASFLISLLYEKFENKYQINAYSFNGSFIIEKLLIWKLKKINSGYKKAKKNKIWRVKEKI